MNDLHDYLCHKPRCAVMGSLHNLPWSPADTSNPCDCGLREAVSALAALPGEPPCPECDGKGEYLDASSYGDCHTYMARCHVCNGTGKAPAARPDTEAPAACWICRDEPFGSTQERERCPIHGLKASAATPEPLHKPTLERAIEVVKELIAQDATRQEAAARVDDEYMPSDATDALSALEQLRDDAEVKP